MAVDAGIGQAGILIALELIDGIVHQIGIEDIQRAEQLKVLHIQTCDLLEKPGLQLCDHVHKGLLAEICQIHEDRYAGGKFDQLFLNLFAQRLVLFLFLRQFLLFLFGEAVSLLFFCLLDLFGFVDDRLDVLVEAAEAFNPHQGFHGLLVGHQALQCFVVHVDQQGALPASGQQGGGGSRHGKVEDFRRVDLRHLCSVIGQNRQKADELLDLLLRTRAQIRVQTAAVIGDLLQGTVQGKVKDIDLFLHDLAVNLPGALHTEGCLKVGFRALQVAQHENAGPGLDGDAGCQLPAGKRDGLC